MEDKKVASELVYKITIDDKVLQDVLKAMKYYHSELSRHSIEIDELKEKIKDLSK